MRHVGLFRRQLPQGEINGGTQVQEVSAWRAQVQRLKKVLHGGVGAQAHRLRFRLREPEEHAFCKEYPGQPCTNRQHLMERLCKKAEVGELGFNSI